MKEALLIWLGIILLIVTLLFPPYGYTKIKTDYSQILKPGEHYDPDLNYTSHEVVPFTYVRHQFILSEPDIFEPRLAKRGVEFTKIVPDTRSYSEVEDMR